MTKYVVKVFVMAAVLLLLNGCWDNKDINHRVMPVVLGISKVDQDFKVYLQIPNPSDEKIKTRIVEESGQSINEIISKISTNMESQVDLLHIKVIVVDEQIAKEGFNKIISAFLRSRDIPSKALFAVCEDDLDEFLHRWRRIQVRKERFYWIISKRMLAGPHRWRSQGFGIYIEVCIR